MSEPIIDFLMRKLRDAGSSRWAAIAEELNPPGSEIFTRHLFRHIVYGARPNLGLEKAQPIYDYFKEIERGSRKLPDPRVDDQPEAESPAESTEVKAV